MSDGTAPVEAVDDAFGVEVEALGEAGGDEAFGVDGLLGVDGVLVAAGGEDVDGEVLGGVEVCASALVNANVLTAAMAMTCFNMSASWAICWNSFTGRRLRDGVLPSQRAGSAPVPGSSPNCAAMIAGL